MSSSRLKVATLVLLLYVVAVIYISQINTKKFLSAHSLLMTAKNLSHNLKKSGDSVTSLLLNSFKNLTQKAQKPKGAMVIVHEKNDYQALRELYNQGNYQWMNVRENLKKSGSKDENEPLRTINEGQNMILKELNDLMEVSKQQRERKLKDMSEYVQSKIHDLMNPSNCSAARTIHCGLINDCGFGCELHFLVNCMFWAFHTNRTIIHHTKNWKFSKQGWEFAFLPVGKCVDDRDLSKLPLLTVTKIAFYKTYTDILTEKNTAEELDSYQVITRSNNRHHFNLPQFNDHTIPESLAESLNETHGDPFAWWIGQIVTYLMRPNERMEKKLEEAKKRIGFKRPIYGIQVRRGDKIGTEAILHPVEEYMFYADMWFERTGTTNNRTVYLATDDPGVLPELQKKYPQYSFIGSFLSTKQADILNRGNEQGLEAIIIDIHLLSSCDYLVCTGSSNVCQAAYELMSVKLPSSSMRFQSLDVPYYHRRQNRPLRVTADHFPKVDGEIELKIGDIVFDSPNMHTKPEGFSSGTNQRTGQQGRFPLFKVKLEHYTHKFKLLTEKK